jgi:hypothetical protein
LTPIEAGDKQKKINQWEVFFGSSSISDQETSAECEKKGEEPASQVPDKNPDEEG